MTASSAPFIATLPVTTTLGPANKAVITPGIPTIRAAA